MKKFALLSLAAVLVAACVNEKQALVPTSNGRSYSAERGRQTGRLDVSSYATVPYKTLMKNYLRHFEIIVKFNKLLIFMLVFTTYIFGDLYAQNYFITMGYGVYNNPKELL